MQIWIRRFALRFATAPRLWLRPAGFPGPGRTASWQPAKRSPAVGRSCAWSNCQTSLDGSHSAEAEETLSATIHFW